MGFNMSRTVWVPVGARRPISELSGWFILRLGVVRLLAACRQG